jgi:hypothetical protein
MERGSDTLSGSDLDGPWAYAGLGRNGSPGPTLLFFSLFPFLFSNLFLSTLLQKSSNSNQIKT